MDVEDYRRTSQEVWEAMAPGWERWQAQLADALTPVRAFRDLDDYEQWVLDVVGPFAMVLRGLPEDEREVLRARLREAFVPFATDGAYEPPGVALCAVAS